MNKERLLKLAEFLENLAPERFNLSSWREHDGDDTDSVSDEQLWEGGCGTTGCAVGWACAMPEFQAEGLYWDKGEGYPALRGLPYSYSGYAVASEFFAIPVEVSRLLFSPVRYPEETSNPKGVAERIRWVAEMSQKQLEELE